jgi:hypothetical protein
VYYLNAFDDGFDEGFRERMDANRNYSIVHVGILQRRRWRARSSRIACL